MRKLLLCTAALSLSGCSFMGMGGQPAYNQTTVYGGPAYASPAPVSRCPSGNCYSRINLEGGIGVASAIDGTMFVGEDTDPATNGGQLQNGGTDRVYDTGYRAELGGSYAINPNTKMSLLGHYEKAESSGVKNYGQIFGANFNGSFSDYETYGVEAGLRHYFRPQRGFILRTIRPYVEGRVGVSRTEDIQIQNATLGGVQFGDGNINFYDDSWVASGAGLVGVETPLTRYSTIGIETGLRYTTGLDADNSEILPGTPLAGSNSGGSNLSVPLMLRGRYRF